MPKQPVDNIADRISRMTHIALLAAMERKSSRLTDDEEEHILDLCTWYALAQSNGLSPQACADAFRAEARGTFTVH
jgi:hypothetical protein